MVLSSLKKKKKKKRKEKKEKDEVGEMEEGNLTLSGKVDGQLRDGFKTRRESTYLNILFESELFTRDHYYARDLMNPSIIQY